MERSAYRGRVRRNRNRAGGRRKLIKMVANPALRASRRRRFSGCAITSLRNFDKLSKVLLPKDEIRRRLPGLLNTRTQVANSAQRGPCLRERRGEKPESWRGLVGARIYNPDVRSGLIPFPLPQAPPLSL